MFKDKLRLIDVKAIMLFTLASPIAAVKRIKHKDLWLLSERPAEARDNGYWMYRYIKENHPEQDVCYVIEKGSKDRERIEPLGGVIRFGSFKHYVYYLLATKHISAHIDADSPNSRVSNFLETHHLLKNKRVFLQHGVIKDILPFCFKSVARADLFCCTTKQERDFVAAEFGYSDSAVVQTGIARFDNLVNKGIENTSNQILIMPTWRAWLARKEFDTDEEARKAFVNSPFYICYSELLHSNRFLSFLEEHDLKAVFFMHSDLQFYSDLFDVSENRIVVKSNATEGVQELLINSKVLITDYSSVFFDFSFMKKQVVFYHFDYAEYRDKQHILGYYDYDNGLGPVFHKTDEIVSYLFHLADQNYLMDKQYKEFAEKTFDLCDGKNRERIYFETKKL